MSHGHGHGAHEVAAPVAGEPTPYLSDPSKFSTARCKRRWNDLALLRLDALAPKSYAGADARFKNESELYGLLRERYLLYVNCIESKPGAEPKNAFLYPQPTAPHH